MKLYHGSLQKITQPLYGAGNPRTDYGLGFYCTQDIELAKEWGCSEDRSGFANEYEFNLEGLSVLDLNKDYNILNWLAILLENRTFEIRSEIANDGKDFILQNFLPDYKSFDVIKGYRADDSYFSFAKAFLNNTISIQKLNLAMKLGKLGEQIVLKSEKSFENIVFLQAHEADREIYFQKKSERDKVAREDFQKLQSSNFGNVKNSLYLIDLIRQGEGANDARIQRTLS